MKLFIKVTIAVLMASLLVTAPAVANSTITTHTKLTANKTKVTKGTKVTWKIHVTSPNKKCYANRTVKWFKNGNFKHNKQVGPQGNLKFTKKMHNTSTYQAKLPKKEFGVHPHHHICEASHSKKIKITVKP
jgi:hypothetical protein